MKSRHISMFAALPLLALVAGCSAESSDSAPQGGDEQDVVGVTDLKELETLFELQVDRYENGKWSRGDDKLAKGPCYIAKKGEKATEPQNWEFRRYTNGAAFFRKKDSGPASGDKRPVACVDFDLNYEGGGGYTTAIEGFALDAAVRYKLGKPTGWDGGAGQMYFAFSDGALKVRDPDNYCGLYGPPERGTKTIDPRAIAQRDTYYSCIDKGGVEGDCGMAAMQACKVAAEKDIAAETIDRPAYLGGYVTEMTWRDLSPEQAMLAYKYAWAKAKSADLFSMDDDPVGRFVTTEEYGDGGGYWHVARFEHLDVHYSIYTTGEPDRDGQEQLIITPKSSDKDIFASAVASCSRPVDGESGAPLAPYTCEGL